MELDLKNLNKQDPLKRMVERQEATQEFSPMDPPDAFEPPSLDEVPYADMHPLLQSLMDDHVKCNEVINNYENVLNDLHSVGFTKSAIEGVNDFFEFFDEKIILHNQKEDKTIFPKLNQILIEKGLFSSGSSKTVIDFMEEDHVKALQLAAIAFNLFGLVTRIPDENSRLVVLDLAVEQSKQLIELLRLHIFREDHIIFAMANSYLAKETLDKFHV